MGCVANECGFHLKFKSKVSLALWERDFHTTIPLTGCWGWVCWACSGIGNCWIIAGRSMIGPGPMFGTCWKSNQNIYTSIECASHSGGSYVILICSLRHFNEQLQWLIQRCTPYFVERITNWKHYLLLLLLLLELLLLRLLELLLLLKGNDLSDLKCIEMPGISEDALIICDRQNTYNEWNLWRHLLLWRHHVLGWHLLLWHMGEWILLGNGAEWNGHSLHWNITWFGWIIVLLVPVNIYRLISAHAMCKKQNNYLMAEPLSQKMAIRSPVTRFLGSALKANPNGFIFGAFSTNSSARRRSITQFIRDLKCTEFSIKSSVKIFAQMWITFGFAEGLRWPNRSSSIPMAFWSGHGWAPQLRRSPRTSCLMMSLSRCRASLPSALRSLCLSYCCPTIGCHCQMLCRDRTTMLRLLAIPMGISIQLLYLHLIQIDVG